MRNRKMRDRGTQGVCGAGRQSGLQRERSGPEEAAERGHDEYGREGREV